MQAIYWAAAFGVGVLLPLQVGVNTQLRSHVGSPLVATLISFAVGTIALLLVTALTRTPWPQFAHWAPCRSGFGAAVCWACYSWARRSFWGLG